MGRTATGVLLLLLCLLQLGVCSTDKVLLEKVSALTLVEGRMTNGRRSSPVPQVRCVGGSARGEVKLPETVQCYNRGHDGNDVQWECRAQLDHRVKFGRISVSCEGYSYPDDPYILKGSCGLEYELDWAGSSHGSNTGGGVKKQFKGGSSMMETFMTYASIAFIVAVVLYMFCSGRNDGGDDNVGGFRQPGTGFDGGPGGGGGGGGYGWRGGPPQPPPPPSYDETMGRKTQGPSISTMGPGRGATGANDGPGFWSGAALGALGGYFMGNRNTDQPRYRGPSEYHRTGGFDDSRYDDRRDGGSSGGSSAGTSTQSGFGGTTRR